MRAAMIGDDATLREVYSSTSLLGEAAIPSMTLIIGANLLGGLKSTGIVPSLIIGIIAIRYVLLPSLGIVIVMDANHFGMVGSDPLYQFTLMLQYAVGTTSQVLETGEKECSFIMPWT
ncbi:hypothetical protein CIPAW_13G020700 [Carya illinoinensis]|uniref:Uncharacterized protein n=1 Tax=Carya illinoinensis TaxID=32201 RepID=A0A8T1NKS2_CARIL|nr:hypothetical protein CIPAW_13G020700 [Carya illinoinensis]KAG6630479.1 hypothetical protein CIPAW_13G020700 [Carya illinoinensis]